MRALVTRLLPDKSREKVLVDDWPEPEAPTGDQIRTRTLYSGITNGTERNDLIKGNYAHPDEMLPAGWGYQNVGKVIETGPDVVGLKVGDVLYLHADHLEYCVVSEAGVLVKLPEEVDRTHASLFGMGSVAMRSVRHANLRMGEKLLVVGAGCIGQIGAQIANVRGARVTICDIDRQRLEAARGIGAAENVVDVSGDGWAKHIRDKAYDAVLDVAGVVDVDPLIKALRKRGRLLLIAGRFKVEYDFNNGQQHEICILQNSGFDRDDLANLCRLVARKQVRIGPLIRDVAPVAEAARIYKLLRDDPSKLLGTVFHW